MVNALMSMCKLDVSRNDKTCYVWEIFVQLWDVLVTHTKSLQQKSGIDSALALGSVTNDGYCGS